MRMQVQSLALLSRLRILCCHEQWFMSQTQLGSCVAMAVAQDSNCSSAPIWPLAWELPYAAVSPPQKKKIPRGCSSGICHGFGSDSVPGPGTSTCLWVQPKNLKKKEGVSYLLIFYHLSFLQRRAPLCIWVYVKHPRALQMYTPPAPENTDLTTLSRRNADYNERFCWYCTCEWTLSGKGKANR